MAVRLIEEVVTELIDSDSIRSLVARGINENYAVLLAELMSLIETPRLTGESKKRIVLASLRALNLDEGLIALADGLIDSMVALTKSQAFKKVKKRCF